MLGLLLNTIMINFDIFCCYPINKYSSFFQCLNFHLKKFLNYLNKCILNGELIKFLSRFVNEYSLKLFVVINPLMSKISNYPNANETKNI